MTAHCVPLEKRVAGPRLWYRKGKRMRWQMIMVEKEREETAGAWEESSIGG